LVGIFPQTPHGSFELFKKGLWLAQVPENSPSFLKIILIAIPKKANPIRAMDNRNISIRQSYRKNRNFNCV
jgi:hypothetical protein